MRLSETSAVTLVAVLLTAALGVASSGSPARAQWPEAGADVARAVTDSAQAATTPARTRKRAPWTLRIPTLGISAPVTSARLSGRTLVPPSDAGHVGWWTKSAWPGSPSGRVVLVGHTLHWGGGVFDRIGALREGQGVDITIGRKLIGYQVTAVRAYGKAALARRATRLFSQVGRRPRLVLITCSGWNGRSFLTNTVVTAKPRA